MSTPSELREAIDDNRTKFWQKFHQLTLDDYYIEDQKQLVRDTMELIDEMNQANLDAVIASLPPKKEYFYYNRAITDVELLLQSAKSANKGSE